MFPKSIEQVLTEIHSSLMQSWLIYLALCFGWDSRQNEQRRDAINQRKIETVGNQMYKKF